MLINKNVMVLSLLYTLRVREEVDVAITERVSGGGAPAKAD